MTDPNDNRRRIHFARIRRLKLLLRFTPRRARFHTYPVVGRFASFARARSYLWSFRYPDVRPAFYAGSILSLMPAIGVQLPLGFALCLLLRANFMVMGGLQFLTNPATAIVVYPATYQLGKFVIATIGFGISPELADSPTDLPVTPGTTEPNAPIGSFENSSEGDAPKPSWTARVGTAFNALILGGLIAGTLLGGLIDILWRWLVLPAAKIRAARKPITATITPHDTPTLPPPQS